MRVARDRQKRVFLQARESRLTLMDIAATEACALALPRCIH